MRPTPVSLKGRALRLLSQREHTRLELERKLGPLAETPSELAQVLDELTQKGFISEERVIESVIHRRASKLGSGRVRQELLAKGLPPEAVQEAVQALRSTELDRARAVWQRKFASPPTDPKERARQARFLLSRGFATEVVGKLLSAAEVDQD